MRCHCTDNRWPTAPANATDPKARDAPESSRAFFFVPQASSNDRQRGSMTTESRTDEWAAELEGQPAADILAWAAHQFAPRVTFGTGFGAEGCVLIHLIAEQALPIRRFHARHRAAVRRRPTNCGGGSRSATGCAFAACDQRCPSPNRRRHSGTHCGPGTPIGAAVSARSRRCSTSWPAWTRGSRPSGGTRRRERARRGHRRTRHGKRPGEDQSARRVEPRRRVVVHPRQRGALQPAP